MAVCLGGVASVAAHVMLAAVWQERRPTASSMDSWIGLMTSVMPVSESGSKRRGTALRAAVRAILNPTRDVETVTCSVVGMWDSCIFSSSSWGAGALANTGRMIERRLGASHRRDASSQVVERSLERHDGGLQRRDMPAMAWPSVAGRAAAAWTGRAVARAASGSVRRHSVSSSSSSCSSCTLSGRECPRAHGRDSAGVGIARARRAAGSGAAA